MSSFIFPTVSQLAAVDLLREPYATGVLKLFKEQIPFVPGLLIADLNAIECDFTGYLPVTLSTLPDPYVDIVRGGVSFYIPTVNFATGAGPVTGNQVWGGWVEDADGALLVAWQLGTPWPMNEVDQQLPLELFFNWYGTGDYPPVGVVIAGQPM